MSDPEFPNTLFPNAYFSKGYDLAEIDFNDSEKYRTDVFVKDSAIAFASDIWPEDKEDKDGKLTPRSMAFVMSLVDGYKAHKLVKRSFNKDETKERLMRESCDRVEHMLEEVKKLYDNN
jgi:hypothetical protein